MSPVPPLAWSLLRRWREGADIADLSIENDLPIDKVREYIMQALRRTRRVPDVAVPKRVGELGANDSRK